MCVGTPECAGTSRIRLCRHTPGRPSLRRRGYRHSELVCFSPWDATGPSKGALWNLGQDAGGGVDREQSPGWQYPPYVTRPQEGGDGGCPGSKWHTSNFPRWILWEWGCEQGRVLQTDRPRTERGRTCQEKLADVTNYAAAFVGHVWCWHTLVVLILLSRARNPYRTMAHGAPS